MINDGNYFGGLEPLEDQPVLLAIGTDVSEVSHTVPTVMLSAATMCRVHRCITGVQPHSPE